MPERDAAALAAIRTYSASTTALRAHLTTFLGTLWRSLGGYRDEQMATFIRGLLPVLQGAEQQMVALTSGYLANMRHDALGGIPSLPSLRLDELTGPATRNGTDPADVYQRPFRTVWIDLSRGVEPQTAIDRGLRRAEKAVATDLQRTKTLTSCAVLSKDENVVGYRRVLEGPESCGLCIVASTVRYHKEDLLPVHPGCDCDVAPIYGDKDPGHTINLPLLQDIHAAVERDFGVSDPSATNYRDLIVNHEHGELGTILARRDDHFTRL